MSTMFFETFENNFLAPKSPQPTNNLFDFPVMNGMDDLSLPMFDDNNFTSPSTPSFTSADSSPLFSVDATPFSTQADITFSPFDDMNVMFPDLSPTFSAASGPPAMEKTPSVASGINDGPMVPPAFVMPAVVAAAAVPPTQWSLGSTEDPAKNVITVPALLKALVHANSSKSTTSVDSIVESIEENIAINNRPKAKVGRKRKIRPTDPEAVLAEQLEKRAKNTLAARKSRQRRLERVEIVEAELAKMQVELDASRQKVSEYQKNEVLLSNKVSNLENMLKLCVSQMKNAGIEVPKL